MKGKQRNRVFAFFLCMILMLGCVLPTGFGAALTLPVSAAGGGVPAVTSGQTVRYVKSGGSGNKDGSSPDNACSSISTAAKEAGTTGGVVVICGDFDTGSATSFGFSIDHPITVTSFYDGTDYRSDATFTVGCSFAMTNDVTMAYLNLCVRASIVISARFRDLTIGEEVNVTRTGSVNYPVICGGWNVSSSSTVAGVSNNRDSVVRIASGTWDTVFCGNYRSNGAYAVGTNTGSTHLVIDGGIFVGSASNRPVSATGMNYQTGKAVLEINGGTFGADVFAVNRIGTLPSDSAKLDAPSRVASASVLISGGTFEKTVGLNRDYTAVGGSFDKNAGIAGKSEFRITGGHFALPFHVGGVHSDVTLYYAPTELQADFLALCSAFSVKEEIREDVGVTLSMPDVTVEAGETFEIAIRLETNPGLCGMRFKLGYDATKLTLLSASYTDVFGGSPSAVAIAKNPVTFLWNHGTYDCTDIGVVARLTFRASGTFVGTTTLLPICETPKDTMNVALRPYELSFAGGNVTVTAPALVWGDLDGSRTVDNADMTLMLRALAGWQTATDAYDLDGNGRVNNRDAIRLARKLAGWS